MVKVKEPDYIDLHKLVTNASPKTVWEKLRAGMSKSEIISLFPDEFHDYIGGMIDPLLEAFESRAAEIHESFFELEAKVIVNSTSDGWQIPRKEYAAAFKKHKDVKYFFALLDNKPIREILWTELKPRESPRDSLTV